MIAIRVDMNNIIATGHVMRCIAIAEAIRMQGENVIFIIADNHAIDILNKNNLKYIILHTEWNKMEAELSTLISVIREYNITKMLIDSYKVTYKYLEELSKWVHTIYIDDLGAFDYPVNTVVCYANYWEKLGYSHSSLKPRYLLGIQYVPLRKEFWNTKPKVISENAKKLLILTGGSDPYNISQKILEALDRRYYQKIDVICGKYNVYYDELIQIYGNEKNIKFHRNVNHLEKYMMETDLAISAGGTTLYELCACGTPTLSYTFVDNQIDNAIQFDEEGIIKYVGDIRTTDIVKNMKKYIHKIMDDAQKRYDISKLMRMKMDGRGAERLAKALIDI